jgi:hypothetical protein
VVRHPLARQVSNFFFLVNRCIEMKNKAMCTARHIQTRVNGVDVTSLSDEEKIETFHEWIGELYNAYPPGNPDHYVFGSLGHGNEEFESFNSTQTSWLVDDNGKIVIEKIFRFEDLSEDMSELAESIPCLKKGSEGNEVQMPNLNLSPKYPHYMLFANNERTRNIIKEVFAADFKNFGYEL